MPRLLLALLLRAILSAADGSRSEVEQLRPADELLAAGAEAYNRGDWPGVILQMERALRARAAHRERLASCRSGCAANHTAEDPAREPRRPLRDLRFFQQLLRRAACLRRCLPAGSSRYQLGEEVELEFRKRSPYNYLQVAYFKINKLKKAVAAAQTFFSANPDHAEMRQNLAYYQMMVGVKDSDFIDLEAKPHMQDFHLGVSYYTEENPQAAILHLEKALDEYWVADGKCRALCEEPYNHDGYNYLEYNADFYQAYIDHYTQVLSCKQGCVTELAQEAGQEKPNEDFLPSHFNYLQFAYYNSGHYGKAVECAKTYLLFFPNDNVMKQNKVQIYRRRSLLEKELLYFAYDVFGIPFIDPDTWTPEEVIPKRLQEKQKVERETAARISEEIGNLMKEIENLVEEKTKESSDMNKLTEGSCFRATLGQEGRIPMPSAYLYYNATEKVRHVMESYFRLDIPLHFSYTHLVCRTAIAGFNLPVNKGDLLLSSAILYLNGDFEGGEFYFTELDATTVTAEVKPQCGRAVGFSAGLENPTASEGHGACHRLWFTLDPRHSERERIQADDLIRMLFKTEETQWLPETGPNPEEAEMAPKETSEKKDEL
ncbi:hypothetical protein E2320_006119 [Naja naja]|nr:hypothetical protein E2320_006119 [Naja naja]